MNDAEENAKLINELWMANREKRRLTKQAKIMRAALTELASEGCTYGGHEPEWDPYKFDDECPGEVCTAKGALRAAKAVKYVNH